MIDVCKTNIDPRLFAVHEAERWNPGTLFHIDGLVQERHNSSALDLNEILYE